MVSPVYRNPELSQTRHDLSFSIFFPIFYRPAFLILIQATCEDSRAREGLRREFYFLVSFCFLPFSFFSLFLCGRNQYAIVDFLFQKFVHITFLFYFSSNHVRVFSWIFRICIAFSVSENSEFCCITILFRNGYNVLYCACESIALNVQNHERLLKINFCKEANKKKFVNDRENMHNLIDI